MYKNSEQSLDKIGIEGRLELKKIINVMFYNLISV